MFGKNPVHGWRSAEDGFLVHSIFFTIQGEGPHVGRPALFVRLAHCNLRCFWCDTDFDEGVRYTPEMLAAVIHTHLLEHNADFVVITGGEPLLQPLNLLIDHPALAFAFFQMETAGTVWPLAGLTNAMVIDPIPRVSIVCSPKTPQVHTELRNRRTHDVYWKYILRASEPVDETDGLPILSTQIEGKFARLFRPKLPENRARIYVQACDEQDEARNRDNRAYAAAIAMKHGYRLSVQIHKILELA